MLYLIKAPIALFLLITTIVAISNLHYADAKYSKKYVQFLNGSNVYAELKELEDDFIMCRASLVLVVLVDVLFTLSIIFIW